MRIILVDDDTAVIQALLAVLRTLPGHEVKVATSGQKALEHAETMGGVDLLITDVAMEPMDGFTLCTQMMERYPFTRTIFISGYDLSEYGDSLQHYEVLQKPVSAATLLDAVNRAFPSEEPAGAQVYAGNAAQVTAEPSPSATTLLRTSSGATTIEEPLSDADSSAGLIGHVIGGYQIVTQLGEGRYGTVYAAVQTSINRPVGLKVLDPQRARDENQKQRFIADARAKANVQHPSILAVYEAGSAAGWIFYTHEYVDGHNLTELAQASRSFPEAMILKILRVVSEGFIYLTRNNIAHAPLDASDIYLSVDNQPRLANLASSQSDQLPIAENEIRALGQAVLPLLPREGVSPGLSALLTRISQFGPTAITAWGALLQAVKALEPKIIPVEAAKISAQDRAAVAAVEAARKQQKRSFYLNLASLGTLTVLAGILIWWKFLRSNERNLDLQVEIPAGEFLFGAGTPTETGQFWIDKYEVTIGQYAKFVEYIEQHPEREKDYDHAQQPPNVQSHIPKNWAIYYGQAKVGGAAHKTPISLNAPMLEVTWWDAYAYAKWKGRDLPSEKEWEKAARGTKGFQYPWGEKPIEKNANSGADYAPGNPEQPGKIDGYNFWCDVDAEKGDESPFGVVGMAGNVSEWTNDWTPDRFPIIKGGNFTMPLKPLSERIEKHAAGEVLEWVGFRTVSHTSPAKQ